MFVSLQTLSFAVKSVSLRAKGYSFYQAEKKPEKWMLNYPHIYIPSTAL